MWSKIIEPCISRRRFFEDLYWMQKVSIILAVVAVDSVVIEFVISAASSAWYVGSQVAYFGGWKKFLYLMTQR